MESKRLLTRLVPAIAFGLALLPARASAQIIDESFNTVTGSGAAEVLSGSGYNEVDDWDSGILGERAFAGTWGDGTITSVFAQGLRWSGVGGSGSGSLVVTGASYTIDGGWYGGLFWQDLVLPTRNTGKLRVRADVKGSVVGGAYQLRVEGVKYNPYGLDEDFSTVTGTGGGLILGPGGIEGWTPNFDNGIDGEAAFAGAYGGAEVFNGVSVFGVPTGGVGSTGGVKMVVDSVSYGAGGDWYAGMVWADQVLPTQDLTQVELRADIKGTAITAYGETLGKYMLRIEDTDGDWLAFDGQANRAWQSLGGPLSTATDGGFSDQLFDPTHGPFGVVIVFDNDTANTWGFGGTIEVDNLFLTGGSERTVVGSVSFDGTSTGGFQSIGGLMSSGVSTFVNVDEDFEDGSATGGGLYFDAASNCNGWTPGWDEGLEGEAAFAGCWGDVQVDGGATAWVSGNSGLSGGAAGELIVEDVIAVGDGGWWAGLMWQEQFMPSGSPNNIFLWADIKGVLGTGGVYGQYHLRLEDAEGDFLAFTGTANGEFQRIGGRLSMARPGTFVGDGTFHRDHPPFTVVVAFFDEWATWGSGGKLIVDNLYLTGPQFGDGAEGYTAVVAFADETASWGSGGRLTVDNLNFVRVNTDTNGDNDTDLSDFGRFQQCFTDYDVNVEAGCESLDMDGDGDIDLDDYNIFLTAMTSPN